MSLFDPPPAHEPLNPYAAPVTEIRLIQSDFDVDNSEAEAVRRLYLGHEAAVKSIGLLHYLGAFIGTIAVVGTLVVLAASVRGEALSLALVGVATYCVLTGGNYALGYGLRRLQPWARWTEATFFLFGLLSTFAMMIGMFVMKSAELAIPSIVGITIYSYVLYLLLSPKGAMVFSPGYRAIIEKTPHIKYKTSWIVKLAIAIFFGVITLAVVLGVIGAMVGNV